MKIHYLQHIAFEGLGLIGEWAQQNNVELSHTKMYMEESLPSAFDFDILIIMGGPMSISDTEEHSWLIKEKAFIKNAIDSNIKVLGICLGAQLLAEALGANVYANNKKEIGFFDVKKYKNTASPLAQIFPETFNAFHWHGDTFDIPEEASPLFYSEATSNQAFSYKDQVIAFQFHIEMNEENIKDITTECMYDLQPDEFVFSAPEIMRNLDNTKDINSLLFTFLDKWLLNK